MSTPNTATAQFFPQGSFRLTDAAVFAQIAAQYGFGVNIIFGVSPATLAATYGCSVVNNPTAAQYQNLPAVFTVDATNTVLGTTISSSADGVQTLGGQSYTDPNGQLFTSVTWEWQVEVQFYSVASAGAWGQEIVSWTGNGINNRVIPTTLNLSTGAVAVWIFPMASVCSPPFRHSGMGGTMEAGNYTTTAGIMTFEATGFSVKDDAPNSMFVNVVGQQYTAVVLQDTTPTNLYMQVGTYHGWPAMSGTHLSQASGIMQGAVTAQDVGLTVAYTGGASPWTGKVLTYIDATHYTVAGSANDGNNYTATAVVANRTLPETTGTGSMTTGPTQLWIFGRPSQMVFAADNMPAGGSVSMGIEAKSLATGITSLSGSGIGVDNNVNGGDFPYAYVSLSIPASGPIRDMFNTFSVLGTGGTVQATGVGFTPTFALARPYTALAPSTAWRGPLHVGTDSRRYDSVDLPTTGIRAFGSGTIDIGSSTAPAGVTVYGFALSGNGTVMAFPTPTWTSDQIVTNPDGTESTIRTTVSSQTSPGTGYTLLTSESATAQWWCRAADGYSVYQIDSPGSGWVACVGPATKNGWYLSTIGFGGQDIVISGGKPANPRAWLDINTWATGQTGMLGGSPQASAYIDNVMVYPGTGYTRGTDYPPIRIFNGRADRELCRLPPTTANVVPKAVMSMLVANGTIYLTSWDSGTTSADWAGRVFQLDHETGILTSLGTVFAAGEMPYALAWHAGRLWCGTNNGIGTVGKIYYFRPGIDTTWTLDYSTATSTAGGVDSMVSYKGKLYVGTDNAAASRGKVLVRDTAGAYTTSQTGTGGTAVVNNGYLALCVFGDNLYASYWNNDATAISKIEKYTGSAWSTAYTGASGTLRPFIVLAVDDGTLYAVGGGKLLAAALLSTPDGASWASLAATLPETDTTLLPMFGPVVN